MQTTPPQGVIIEIDSDNEDLAPSGGDILGLNEVEDDFNDGQSDDSTFLRFGGIPEPPDLWQAHIDERVYYEACLAKVLDVFPDISHDHVRQVYDVELGKSENGSQRANISEVLILGILDQKTYPKEKDRINELKRKRSNALDSDEEEAARWKDLDRGQETIAYFREARTVLQEEFVSVPSRFIDLKLRLTGNFYAAYLALELAEYTYTDTNNPGYAKLKSPRKVKNDALTRLDNMDATSYGIPELKQEIQAARKRRKKEDAKRQIIKDAAAAEAAIDKEYRDNGDVLECQCCFDTYPINKITHCDGDEPHFFCLECAESNAKNEIGNSRYKLTCMDGSGCKASFSREQKQRFLDVKSFETLERIQQQAELKLADLPNLTACPFCNFAAICPPVDVDKEFRCDNPNCEKISCRLCRLESHLPLTCEESKKENGISERHVIEEARTQALLRTCPKCDVKILKEDGCNKVVCTCGGMLCDYCGKDISEVGYVHFDGGTGPTGKKCPTYDNFRVRRNKEVEKAEAEALEKIRRDNPNINADDLKIKFTDKLPTKREREVEANAFPGGGFQLPNRLPGHHDHRFGNDIPVIPPHLHHHHLHHHPGPGLHHEAARREQEAQAFPNRMNQMNHGHAALHNQPPIEQQIRAQRLQLEQHHLLVREAQRAAERERFRAYHPMPDPNLNEWPNDDFAALFPGPFNRDRFEQMPIPEMDIGQMARNAREAARRRQR